MSFLISHFAQQRQRASECVGAASAPLALSMAVVRPWVKGDLQTILHIGANRGAPMRRFRSQQKRQHVQCVEVDTERSAVKINDSETLVWCFVSKPGMKNVSGERNSKTPNQRCA